MPTQAELAKHIDLSTRRLRELLASGALPASGGVDETRVAYIRYLREQAAGRGASGDLNEERTRLTKEQADKLARENAIEDGRLIDSDDAVQAWGEMIVAAKSRLLVMPGRIAKLVARANGAKEAERIIEDAVYEALNELREWNPADDGKPETGKSPKRRRKAMGATEATES